MENETKWYKILQKVQRKNESLKQDRELLMGKYIFDAG